MDAESDENNTSVVTTKKTIACKQCHEKFLFQSEKHSLKHKLIWQSSKIKSLSAQIRVL